MPSLNKPDYTDKQILIVENDFASAYLLIETFRHIGVKSIFVSDASAVLNICDAAIVNMVVISNSLLGVINSTELTRRVKRYHPELPVIAYSSNSELSNINNLYSAGCDYFILKPVNIDFLTNLVTIYLDMYKELQGSVDLVKNNILVNLN